MIGRKTIGFSKRIVAFLLIIAMLCIVGCSNTKVLSAAILQENVQNESVYSEDVVNESFQIEEIEYEEINEETIQYEYQIEESIVCQQIVFETVVDAASIEQQIPEEILDYNVDWKKVIGKFAVGTAIIISVGVIHQVSHGSTFFLFASPIEVTKEALAGGALMAAANTALHALKDGNPIAVNAKKYAIEGFADGYMWGAIASVLRVSAENLRRLKAFKFANKEKAVIKASGRVVDKKGKDIGQALWQSDDTWTLLNEKTGQMRFFDKKGVELKATEKVSGSCKLYSVGDNCETYYLDSKSTIYRKGDKLVPNAKYQLEKGGNVGRYEVDALGRIKNAKLELKSVKETSEGRFGFKDSIEIISNGYHLPGDDRGHLMADRFFGESTIANMLPMSKNANRSAVKEIENEWAKAIKKGKTVRATITPKFHGNSRRPYKYIYKYIIDGKKFKKAVIN